MSDEIIKVLDDISSRLGIVIDWANENVMQQLIFVYHKYIIYSIVKHAIYLALSTVVMIIFLKGFVYLYQQYNKCYNEGKDNLYFHLKDVSYTSCYNSPKQLRVETNDNTYVCIAISLIICFVMLIIALYNLHYLIQAIITPEFYVLNDIRAFMRNM